MEIQDGPLFPRSGGDAPGDKLTDGIKWLGTPGGLGGEDQWGVCVSESFGYHHGLVSINIGTN